MCNVITNVTLDYWYTVIMWIRWRGLSDSLITTLSHGLSMCTSMLSVCMPTNLPFYSVDLCMGSLFCTINDVSTQFFWILQQYRCLYKKKKKKNLIAHYLFLIWIYVWLLWCLVVNELPCDIWAHSISIPLFPFLHI